MDYDFHKHTIELNREMNRVREGDFPEENKDLLIKFAKELQVEGIKAARIIRYLKTLRIVQQWKRKLFTEWTVDDLKDVVFEIENNGYKVQTINEFRKGLRKFFKWLKGKNWEGLEVVRGERKDKRKPDVLTEEEISRMIEAAINPRDQTIIAVGYEAGLRIGELATLTWGNVTWTEWGARIKVHGKTGERVIPIVMAASYLKKWMIDHPYYDLRTNTIDPDALVFVRFNGKGAGKPLTYNMYSKIIKQAARKAGIKKRVYPHILRHSRATVLANKLTEHQMNIYFGWVQGSDMPSIYVHLSGRDIEGAIKEVYGLEDKEEDKTLKPVKCPRCAELNTPYSRFCHKCGLPLDEKERLKAQLEEAKLVPEKMTKILEDPKLREEFKAAIMLAEALEDNPEGMKKLNELIEEMLK